MNRRTWTWCWLSLALLCGPASAGLDPTLLTDLHHDVWTSKEGAPIDASALAQTPDGWIWLATPNGLYRFDGVRFERFQPRQGEGLLEVRIASLFAAPDGALWVGYGGGGASVLRQGRLTHHAAGMPQEAQGGVATGPDGRAWRATENGMAVLDQPGAGAAPAASAMGGAANSAPYVFDRAGNFWTRNNNHTLRFIRADELAGKTAFTHEAVPRETLTLEQQKRGRPAAFLADMEGNIWLATTDGLERYRGQRVHCLSMDQKYSAFSLASDGPDALWVAPRPGRDLWRVGASALTQVDGAARNLADLGFAPAQPAPVQVDGAFDGIDVGKLVRQDAQHGVVMGETGMAARIGPRFYRLRTDPPELLANAQAMTASANGDRWINTNGGLVHILAADWLAWMAQPQRVVKTALFDAADGYPGAQGTQSSLMTTTDNGKRVWFVGKLGLAWIDSTKIIRNAFAPRVEVVRLHAGAQAYFGDEQPRLVAGTRNISIDYTALSFVMPERLRFQYRLVGFDDAWQDGGARRMVAYTNLEPGDYRFEVIAANEDDVWGAVPATMTFSIAPLFTQTWWFVALYAVAVLGALALLYRARMRTVHRHLADRMHERLYERERIARSLHDTYLQSVQGLIYVFHDVAQRLSATGGAQAALDRALTLADDVLIQGREQVLGLRTSARGAGTLAQSLDEICQALAAHEGVTCTIVTSGVERPLRAHVAEELFYIGREALINAVRHAQCTRAELTLHYDARRLAMSIEDDGIGLPPAMLAQGRRDGHWGLMGMRERAAAIHGTLALSNAPGGGARIVLAVPGRRAYAGAAPARWWPFARRR